MQITVKLFATFRAGRFVSELREYPEGTRVADVVRELQISEPEIGMIMLNNRHAEMDHTLSTGENLALFPLLGGG
jgi:sulfur-carrier protein